MEFLVFLIPLLKRIFISLLASQSYPGWKLLCLVSMSCGLLNYCKRYMVSPWRYCGISTLAEFQRDGMRSRGGKFLLINWDNWGDGPAINFYDDRHEKYFSRGNRARRWDSALTEILYLFTKKTNRRLLKVTVSYGWAHIFKSFKHKYVVPHDCIFYNNKNQGNV